MTRALSAIAVAMLGTVGAVAEPSIEVTLSPTELTVGDRVEMVVTVRTGQAGERTDVRFQPWGETLGPAEVVDVGPIERIQGPGGSTTYRQRLSLTLFRVGEATLPPIEASLIDSDGERPLTSSSTKLVVHSVLPEDSAEIEAKPPAPPQRLGLGRRFWWAAAALLATCLVAILTLWRQSDDLDGDEEGRPRIAPMEELQRALATLRSETQVLPLHAELSLAVRRYLGRVLTFQARESTTTEIRRQLRDRHLSADLVRQTSDLLLACDMVKFARRSVDLEAARSRIGIAETIADGMATTVASIESGADADADLVVERAKHRRTGSTDLQGDRR